MSGYKFLKYLPLLYVLLHDANSSHFRGGTVSWKHISRNNSLDMIEIRYRFGWRRNWETPQCDDLYIQNRTEGYPNGKWTISTGYTYVPENTTSSTVPTTVICTAYDSHENWAYGYNSFKLLVNLKARFTITFSGSAWIEDMNNGGSSWTVPALVDLGERSDTGKTNNPPETFSSPIVRLKLGCPSTTRITSIDNDGDNVTCRYASIGNTEISDECGSVCSSGYPHFTLDKEACLIYYDGGGAQLLTPVALMLEDHPQTTILVGGSRTVTPSDALSQIPLQFLVNISSSGACNVVPTYPTDSVQENVTFTVPDSGGSLEERLSAFPSDSTATVIQFVVLGPVGVQSSTPIHNPSNGAYYSNITWTPNPAQAGTHIICYYALDSLGINGDQVCFVAVVSDSTSFDPCSIDNGGCNDLCIPDGPIRTCACTNACWRLLEDSKTCAPPMDISCDGERMQISVPSCASNNTIVVGSHSSYSFDPLCQSAFDGGNYVLNFSRSECGLTSWSNPVAFQYETTVWFWMKKKTISPIITRGEWKGVPVSCSIFSESETVNGSFVPQLPYDKEFFPTEVVIEGMGDYSLFFEFYSSGQYNRAVPPSEYPVEVTVNDRMYFSLGAVGRSGVKFFTKECTASSVSSDGPKLDYKFIKDGCFLDTTLIRHPSTSELEDRISMEAFDFENNLLLDRAYAEISIQCEVLLCDALNSTTRCFRGCLKQNRKKRSLPIRANSRVTRQAKQSFHEDDDAIPALSVSESPLQKTSTKIIMKSNANEDPRSSGEITVNDGMIIFVGQLILFGLYWLN